jgi:hypothetical protein
VQLARRRPAAQALPSGAAMISASESPAPRAPVSDSRAPAPAGCGQDTKCPDMRHAAPIVCGGLSTCTTNDRTGHVGPHRPPGPRARGVRKAQCTVRAWRESSAAQALQHRQQDSSAGIRGEADLASGEALAGRRMTEAMPRRKAASRLERQPPCQAGAPVNTYSYVSVGPRCRAARPVDILPAHGWQAWKVPQAAGVKECPDGHRCAGDGDRERIGSGLGPPARQLRWQEQQAGVRVRSR